MYKPTGEDVLLTRAEAARFLRKKVGTLASWDCRKRHQLKPIRIGGRVHYRLNRLKELLAENSTP